MVQRGSIWRIGNGEKVRIRGDNWLHDPYSRQVISPQKNFPNCTHVCALIDETILCWLEDRVRDELLPHEAEAVLSIPLSKRRPEDSLIWQRMKNGVYTTRSAYRMLAEIDTLSKPGQSNPAASNGIWKQIWSLNVPNKIKHFLWRACGEALPTKKNLCKRKVICNASCESCGKEEEDTIHALWECQVLKEIWWEIDICRSNLLTRFTCFRDLLTGIFQVQEPNQAEKFAYVAWGIWTKRNTARMGQVSTPYQKIYAEAMDRLQEFHAVQVEQPITDTAVKQHRWRPPPSPLLKVNFDGALFMDSCKAGIGVVIRDSAGKVIWALSERIPLPKTVEDVEALAYRRAIEFALEKGLQQVVLEGDSATILNSILGGLPCLAPYGNIIEDSIILASQLSHCSFSHVCRKGNAVADKLAKLAKHLNVPKVWLDNIPSDVNSLVVIDSNSVEF